MAKISKPLIYGGIGVIAITAVILSSTEPDSSDGQANGKPVRGSSSRSQVQDQFTEEDAEAVYVRLNESARNAFNPLVIREGIGGPGGGLMPNELPPSFADGEAGWAYTGTVEINGVPSALLENDVTGDGMFLKVGEKLKKTTITRIAPTYIELESYTGRTVTLDLLRDLPDPNDDYFDTEIEPVRPNVGDLLSGSIRGAEAAGNNIPKTSEE